MTEELTIFFFLSLVLTAIVFAPCKLGGSYILFWLVNFVTTATGIGGRPHSALSCSGCCCSGACEADGRRHVLGPINSASECQ